MYNLSIILQTAECFECCEGVVFILSLSYRAPFWLKAVTVLHPETAVFFVMRFALGSVFQTLSLWPFAVYESSFGG